MQRIPISARYIFTVFLAGLMFFTLFRCLFIYNNVAGLHNIPGLWGIMARTMLMGLRFDIVVCGYILLLPAVVLMLAEIFGLLKKLLLKFIHVFICIVFSLAFFICSSDIPFFKNYNNRLNVSILNWTDTPGFMIKMVWEDKSLLAWFFFFVFISIVFIIVALRIYRKHARLISDPARPKIRIVWRAVTFVLVSGLMVLGIRGRTDEKSPIMVGTAYFCNYDIPNQAGLNPVFTFMWSWTDDMKAENKSLHLMDNAQAVQNVQRYLHITPSAGHKDFPLYREIVSNTPEHKYNVVVVIMESMSGWFMQRYGNERNLTPNLDSLANKGYSFDNFYSSGIHTFNGIFSVIYSYPALLNRHTMEGAVIPHYTGLPWFMRQRGYETMYYTTHDDQFDNVGGFVSANNIAHVTSKSDYPGDNVISTLGVPDHVMFDYSIPTLNEFARQNKPFFAVYMTATNHNPYIVPPNIDFKPKHTEIREGCVEYADWAIGQYMKHASKEPWFANTIFVFTGDHGATYGAHYEGLPLTYSHVPCIIYSPLLRDSARAIKNPGGQIDIFPTVAGILGGNYSNNTLGVDLLHDSRPYMFFSQDDKIGVADTFQLYIWRKSGPESLMDISDTLTSHIDNRAKADSMKKYAFSMIQTYQWMLDNKKTGPVNK